MPTRDEWAAITRAIVDCGSTVKQTTIAIEQVRAAMIDMNTDNPGVIKSYRCSSECEDGQHGKCGHVLWAVTSANPYRPNVCYCNCPCHNPEASETIASLRHMLKELKR